MAVLVLKIHIALCEVVFAYGATDADKTYTILGTIDSPGITFSALMDLNNRLMLFKMYVVLWDVVFAYGATGAGKTYTMLGTVDFPGVLGSRSPLSWI